MNDMPTGLIRRGGAYSLRRRIPKDLIPLYGGRQEIVRALGTNDREEAKRRHALTTVALNEEFDALRPKVATPPLPHDVPLADISPTLIALVHLDTLREDRDAAAAQGNLPTFNFACKEALRLYQGMLDGEIPASDELRVIEGHRNALRALLTGENAFAISAARKARTAIEAANATVLSKGSQTLDVVVGRWAAERTPTKRSITAHRAVAEWFDARTGGLTVEMIAKRDVVSFKDQLVRFTQLSAEAAGRGNSPIPCAGFRFASSTR